MGPKSKAPSKKTSANKPVSTKVSASKYVDGFVFVVPKKNLTAYKKMAKEGAKIWTKFGAIDYKECMLNDPKPEHVTFTFPIMTQAKPSETVWFSYITYKSKKHRDQVNAKVMKEMEETYKDAKDMEMPFDMNRMALGGFEVVVSS